MSHPAPTPDQPITTGTIRRLLAAAAAGCLVVSAFSMALTAGFGTPTAYGLAAVAAAAIFAATAFDIVETRAAQRAALVPPVITHMACGELRVDDERAEVRLATHAEFATLVVAAGIGPVLGQPTAITAHDVARAAVDALIDEPELLDNLAEFVIAVGSLGADEHGVPDPEPAGVAT